MLRHLIWVGAIDGLWSFEDLAKLLAAKEAQTRTDALISSNGLTDRNANIRIR